MTAEERVADSVILGRSEDSRRKSVQKSWRTARLVVSAVANMSEGLTSVVSASSTGAATDLSADAAPGGALELTPSAAETPGADDHV